VERASVDAAGASGPVAVATAWAVSPPPEFSFGGLIMAVAVMLAGVLAIPVLIAVVTAVLQGPR
jgi:hypothetical protein